VPYAHHLQVMHGIHLHCNQPKEPDMPAELWIFIVLLGLFLLGLVSYIVMQIAKAKEDFKKIDYSKLRKWKDDDW
jgi:hypothetical protein